jgi:hypothetical protein
VKFRHPSVKDGDVFVGEQRFPVKAGVVDLPAQVGFDAEYVPAGPVEEPAAAPDGSDLATLTVENAVLAIEAAEDLPTLDAFFRQEDLRKGGPRSKVIKALSARREALKPKEEAPK